ncbi:hypothetical protein F4679DRAFT_550744 [Xylaria curta]|nr:hypothetical protein F4679DRAFT_550744 [Xylaria curta]
MASNDLESGVSATGCSADMNLDIWHLILGQIDSHKDFYNVCLTSRAWYTMAMPHLYKVVPLTARPRDLFDWEREKDPMLFARSLSSRLLDTENEGLRNAVHELDFGNFEDAFLNEMENRLVTLVDGLPNLQRVKIRSRLTQKVLEDLAGHSRRIPLHLLGEDGKREIESDLENVVALAAKVNPSNESEGPNRRILGIQKLLFACPNLTSFSLEIVGGYGGCVRSMPRFERVYSFRLSGDETFPPLEELSLSGYRVDEAECEQWQKNFQWSKLRSLTLGPRYTADFLKLAAGHARSLRELTVKLYTDADRKTGCPPLEQFLNTFTSLESLTVKGYHLPIEPIANHPGLKHLCLHSFEVVYGDTTRPTLSIEQLQRLDRSCALLETLELDLYRDGEWPEHILRTLATGFKNLRRLTLHLELGLKSVEGMRSPDPETCVLTKPILNKDSAREVGQQFFQWRSSSNLNTLVLKTGEPLRRYPQWEPGYSVVERGNEDTVEVHKPCNTGDVPEVTIMEESPWLYY